MTIACSCTAMDNLRRLREAVMTNDATKVLSLLERHRINVNVFHWPENHLLIEAILKNNHIIVGHLLEFGANANICTNERISALELASLKNNPKIISLLKAHGACPVWTVREEKWMEEFMKKYEKCNKVGKKEKNKTKLSKLEYSAKFGVATTVAHGTAYGLGLCADKLIDRTFKNNLPVQIAKGVVKVALHAGAQKTVSHVKKNDNIRCNIL